MRAPAPGPRYSQEDESAFRRLVEQELGRESQVFRIGGGVLAEDPTTGKLTYTGRNGTVTELALP